MTDKEGKRKGKDQGNGKRERDLMRGESEVGKKTKGKEKTKTVIQAERERGKQRD